MKKAARGIRKSRLQLLLITALIMSLTIGTMNSMTVFAETEASGEEETPDTPAPDSLVTERMQPENLNNAGYDIVYVIDNSLSIWEEERKVRNQAFKNITNLAVGSNNRIGALYFGDHVDEKKELTMMMKEKDYSDVFKALEKENVAKDNQDTNIGNAFETAITLFDGQNPSRERIIILFSDGVNRNLAGDPEYTKEANKKTKEQTKILKEMGVKIYCIYLKKDADRSDEDYLCELVNYFPDEGEDVHYDEERFQSIPMDDISSLSSTFADVFYKMQNNMKYIQIRKEDLDSNGSKGFYLPSVGINRLDIYLDGNVGDYAQVIPAGDCESYTWPNDTATFYTYIDPVPGDWYITIDGTVPDDFFGTIACYANLSTDIEFQNTGNNSTYRAIARFYDENGKEIPIDSSVSVTMEYAMAGAENGDTIPLNMTVQDGMAVSNNVAMKEFGDYRFRLQMTYKDSVKEFVNLSYEVPFRLENRPPITYDQIGEKYRGMKCDGGLQASIDKNVLFRDPDGDSVMITGVTQLGSSNKVSVEEEEGYVRLISEKAGDFAVKLTVEDNNGASSEVKIEGIMRDIVMEWIAIIAACIVAAIVLIMLIRYILKKINLKKKYERSYDDIVSMDERWDEEAESSDEYREKLKTIREEINKHLYGFEEDDEEYPGIVDYAENMPETLQTILGIRQYMEEDYEKNLFDRPKEIIKEIKELGKERRSLREQADKEHRKEKNFDNEALTMMSGHQKEMQDLKKKLTEKIDELREVTEEISETEQEMSNCTIDEVVEGEFCCDVKITDISGFDGAVGYMSKWVGFNNESRFGYYCLDDIKVIGNNRTLKSQGIDSEIYVINYYDEETDRDGILLKAAERFYVKDETGTYNPYDEWILFKGESAQIKIKSGINKSEIKMKVTAE